MSKIMSVREYSRKRGISEPSVRHAIKTGRIKDAVVNQKTKKGGIMLDADIADAKWHEGLNTADSDRTRGRRKGVEPERSGVPIDPEDLDELPLQAESHRREAHYKAMMAKLKFQEKSKELVNREEAERQSYEFARRVRDRLLGIPDRVESKVAVESDPATCRQIIRDEIIVALKSLTKTPEFAA